MDAYNNDLHLTRNLAQESANRASYLRSLTGRNFLFGGAALVAALGVGFAAIMWANNQRLDPEVLRAALAKMPTLKVEGKVDATGTVEMAKGSTVELAKGGTVTLDKASTVKLADGSLLKIDPGATVRLSDDSTTSLQKLLSGGGPSGIPQTQTKNGQAIKREVTVFQEVQHGQGRIVTGWKYHDGESDSPFSQFCYYSKRTSDSIKSEDVTYIGADGHMENTDRKKVPDFEAAYGKCLWFGA
jgi:hypothetical protein